MPMLYGEGKKAFCRFQLDIVHTDRTAKTSLHGEVGTCLRYFNVDMGGFLHVSFTLISLFIP